MTASHSLRNLIIIDNNQQNTLFLSQLLEKKGYEVCIDQNGELTKKMLHSKCPDLILINFNILMNNPKFKANLSDIPLIGILNKPFEISKAFHIGCADYIMKPFKSEEVERRVETHLKIKDLQKELKEIKQEQKILKKTKQDQREKIVALIEENNNLKNTEAFTNDILDAQLDTFFLFEPQTGKALRWNQAFTKISGYTDEEISHMPAPQSYYSSSDLEKATVYIQKILNGESGTIEIDLLCKGGHKIPFEYKASPIRNKQKEVNYMIAIGRDISERKRMEQELRTTQMHYTDFINASTDHVSYWKVPQGFKIDLPIHEQVERLYHSVCIDSNIACCKSFGFQKKEDLIGKKYIEVIREKTFDAILKKFVQNQYILQNEHFIQKKKVGNSEHYGILSWYGVVENNELINLWSISKDITELRLIEKELTKSEEMFRTVVDYTYAWEYWQLPNGTLRYVSPSCERITGYTPQNFMMNQNLLEEIVIDKSLWIQHRNMEQEKNEYIEFRIKTKEQEICWIGHECHKVYDNSSGEYLGIRGSNRDITALKHMQEQIIQSQKMEAIGHLAGGIAHDFNNILSAIIGYSELSLSEVPKDSILEDDITQILQAAHRAKHLVTQILSFSRQSNEVRAALFLSPIIKEVVDLLRASLPSTIEMRTQIAKDTKPVLANGTKIYEVIMNLCTNAAYAMKEKGILDIIHEEVEMKGELSGKMGRLKPGFYSKIVVKDTGIGISPKVLNKIFEPYYTTKPIGKGTGLGLAVVFGIVKSHKGNILVESKLGTGTKFQVFLPKTHDPNPIIPDDNKKSSFGNSGNENIMFIDDEEILCNMISKMLGRLGYKTTIYSDSRKALQVFQKNPESFDLVITDQTMPNITGVELAKEFLDIRADIPIILCSGYSKEIKNSKILEMGIKGFIKKPFRKKELLRKIRTILESTPT